MNLCLNILEIICILFLIIFISVCVISFIENRKLVVSPYIIQDPLIPHSFDGFKIVHLTDMHNTTFGKNNEKLIKLINDLSPDIIVVTGDMIIGTPNTDVSTASDTMNRLTGIAPVYFSMGNHELRVSRYRDRYGDMWDRFISSLSPDIHKLFDSSDEIVRNGQKIFIHGLSLTPKMYTRFKDVRMPKQHLKKRFGISNENEFHIFLAHNPDYFKDYANWGAKLIFSGHVHGGIVRLPFFGGVISPKMKLFPPYDKGLFEISNKYMILSGGLGNHTINFRLNNLPEVVYVTLYNSSTSKAFKRNNTCHQPDQI